ncbi:MAG TPA: M20/M25/M40 family metallo-hydrolase [bacterium]|nr:M20/M25/M40 family metallo-hydrolase [bacterium]
MKSAAEITAFLDAQRERQEALLAELVRTPSDNPPGDCAPHAARTQSLLEALGLAVAAHPVPEAECQAAGMRSVTNLIVRERFGPGSTLVLNAHGDAVPPGEGWSADPYGAEVREGWMLGRGVAVSKSDIAAYAFTLLALRDAGLARGTVELHVTYDEEAGGRLGPQWLLTHGLTQPDYAICAGFSYAVVTAHNGCLHLELSFHGVSAHAAEPEQGRDALEAATMVLASLYAHRRGYTRIRSATPGIGSPTLVAGLISGGTNTNVVPDRVTVRLDRRIIPEEQPERVQRELTEFIQRTAALIPGVSCEVRCILSAAPLKPLIGAERLATVLQRHGGVVLGESIPTRGLPLYTDARHYAAAGIPTVLYGAGPRSLAEANAHRADERLKLDDLARATRVLTLAVGEVLGQGA